ncbi:MAG: hypothetical protein IJB19_02920 [Clostridia bacterium]|nr:hypothetical protein [Clostridia bacterium]
MDNNEMPLGFGFALAQNPKAMEKFSNLSEAEQTAILQKAHAASSKTEMQSLVNTLSAQG